MPSMKKTPIHLEEIRDAEHALRQLQRATSDLQPGAVLHALLRTAASLAVSGELDERAFLAAARQHFVFEATGRAHGSQARRDRWTTRSSSGVRPERV